MSITGLGPHGERAAPPSRVTLSDADVAAASERRFSVAVVLHTGESDWSRQQLAGVTGVLGSSGIVVAEVVDCGFDAAAQIEALDRLSSAPVDAVISIPVANAAVADAHRRVSEAGKKLLLLDNVPTGLLPGRHYASLVSADNFGLGLIAAELLCAEVGEAAEIALVTYGVDFYATNERDIAFSRWIRTYRPDLTLRPSASHRWRRSARPPGNCFTTAPRSAACSWSGTPRRWRRKRFSKPRAARCLSPRSTSGARTQCASPPADQSGGSPHSSPTSRACPWRRRPSLRCSSARCRAGSLFRALPSAATTSPRAITGSGAPLLLSRLDRY